MLKSVKRFSAKLFATSKDGTAWRDSDKSSGTIGDAKNDPESKGIPSPSPIPAPPASRRNSMPATLMSPPQREGKAAIQDLLKGQPGAKKEMVFGQYFNHADSPKKEATAAPSASRYMVSSAMAAHKQELQHVSAGVGITRVSEDEEGIRQESASTPSSAAPGTSTRSNLSSQTNEAIPEEPSRSISQDLALPPGQSKIMSVSKHLPVKMMRENWSLSDYQIGRKMYTGYASTVYQAKCKRSGDQVALKVYHMENLCELNHYQVHREIRVHSTLQHQNIIHLFAAFQEGSDIVLVQEYAEGGDLYRQLHKNGGRLGERQAVEIVLHPFLLALHYLHTQGIMHRDIKPENVLFTENRVLKLADFGLAIDLREERAVTRAGTLDYMAPEVLRCPPKNSPHENKTNSKLYYNNSVDAWAVGVFAYELIVGFPPFAGDTQLDSVERIMHSTPDFPEETTELAKAFICQALKKHPGDRPTVMEMIHHPWVHTYQRRASMLHIPASRARRQSSITDSNAGAVMGMAPLIQPLVQAAPIMASLSHKELPAALSHKELSGALSHKELSGALSHKELSGALSHKELSEEMSPDDIEDMIRKLQVAKQAALERVASKNGNTFPQTS